MIKTFYHNLMFDWKMNRIDAKKKKVLENLDKGLLIARECKEGQHKINMIVIQANRKIALLQYDELMVKKKHKSWMA